MHILIVDDEHYIVDYLSALILEHAVIEPDIHKTYSGLEALKVMSEIKIDLMLLDINMPGISGIETAEKAAENWPRCRMIFFTAYSDFNYIYQTNKLKNTTYLLKTEEDDVILKEVFAALSAIEKEREGFHVQSETQKRNRLLTHMLQQNILKEILSGHCIDKLCNDLLLNESDFVLDLHRPVYLMYMHVHYRTLKEQQTNVSEHALQYLQLMEQFLLGRFHYAMLEVNQTVSLWFFQQSDNGSPAYSSPFTYLKTMTDDFSDYCTTTLHRQLTLVLSSEQTIWSQVCVLYHNMAQHAELTKDKSTFMCSTVSVLPKNSSATYVPSATEESDDIERNIKELSACLHQGLKPKYFELLQRLRSACLAVKSIHHLSGIKIYSSIALMLINYTEQHQLQENLSERTAIYPLYCVHDFAEWDSAFDYLKQFSLGLFDLLDTKKLFKHEQITNKIRSYIREHLEEPLTLSKLSGIVNYNDTYISRLFKQITGIRLSEYITQERIQKSKFLLAYTTETIQNIASAVGFDTAQYFSVVFKKTTGMSPNEYRHTHLKV